MRRLRPASRGPLRLEDVVKTAQAQARRDMAMQLLQGAARCMAKQAEGERGGAAMSGVAGRTGPLTVLQDAAMADKMTHSVMGPALQPHRDRQLVQAGEGLARGELEKEAFRKLIRQTLSKAKGFMRRLRSPVVPKARAPGVPSPIPAAKTKGRKGLVRTLLPGALLAGGAYTVAKGVPAAVNFASRAASQPMAPGGGYQSAGWGFNPQQTAY